MNKISKNLSKFKLITFDVTDTLLSFKQPPQIEYAKETAKFGYKNVDVEKIGASFRENFKLMNENYPNFGRTRNISWEKWWQILVTNILKSSEVGVSDKHAIEIADSLIDKYENAEFFVKDPFANELINKIKNEKKKVGIISNYDPRLKFLVQNIELPAFDFVLASYEVGAAKPDEKIFDLAIKLAGEYSALAPEQSLHIGNTPQLDYIAAREAGWFSCLITNHSNEWQKYPEIQENHTFSSLKEFLHSLENDDIKW